MALFVKEKNDHLLYGEAGCAKLTVDSQGWDDGGRAVGWTLGTCLQGGGRRTAFLSRPSISQVTLLKRPHCQNSDWIVFFF